MAEIRLACGAIALVDTVDLAKAASLKWHLSNGYAKHSYRKLGKVNSLYLHTLLTGLARVDHRNGNRLDNRRENLRPANDSQNQANRKKKLGTTSAYKGVCWHVSSEKWKAYIGPNSRNYLGLYESEIDAARAYNAEAARVYGKFAKLNAV